VQAIGFHGDSLGTPSNGTASFPTFDAEIAIFTSVKKSSTSLMQACGSEVAQG
jgi:hypothetical protein